MNTQLDRVIVLAPGSETRVPVLRFVDAIQALAGVECTVLSADADADIDAALTTAFGPADSSTEPRYPTSTALVVAGGDGVVRAALRRAIRRVAPPPSKRPAWLAEQRTIGELPPVGILPLGDTAGVPNLVTTLELPATADDLAKAIAVGSRRQLDVLRNDHGSATLHGVMLGQADEAGRALPWQACIDVDAANLTDGGEPILACAIANAGGYSSVAGLQLIAEVTPDDGLLDVAIAVPAGELVEVRRARGRAVAVDPAGEITCTDDGVDAVLSRKKTWWIEKRAWSVFTC